MGVIPVGFAEPDKKHLFSGQVTRPANVLHLHHGFSRNSQGFCGQELILPALNKSRLHVNEVDYAMPVLKTQVQPFHRSRTRSRGFVCQVLCEWLLGLSKAVRVTGRAVFPLAQTNLLAWDSSFSFRPREASFLHYLPSHSQRTCLGFMPKARVAFRLAVLVAIAQL